MRRWERRGGGSNDESDKKRRVKKKRKMKKMLEDALLTISVLLPRNMNLKGGKCILYFADRQTLWQTDKHCGRQTDKH